MSLSLLFLLLLQACPDPTTASDLGHGPGGGASSEGGPPSPGAGKPLGPPPPPGSFEVAAGTGVTISGELVYAGEKTGTFRIDFLRKEGEAPPLLAHMVELDGPGPFSVEAPPSTGALYVVGFVDVDRDGPSTSDPAGMLAEPIEVGTDPIADLVLTLTDAPDLAEFTPGDHAVAPIEDIPALDAPAEAPATDEAAVETAPDEAPAAEEAPAEEAPAEEAPAEEAPAEAAPDEEAPAEEAPAEEPEAPAEAPSE